MVENCVKFSFVHWFVFFMVGLMRFYLEAGMVGAFETGGFSPFP